MSQSNNYLTAKKFTSLNSSSYYNNRTSIRRRLDFQPKLRNLPENSNTNNYRQNSNNKFNSISIQSSSRIYNRQVMKKNSSTLITETQHQPTLTTQKNSQTIDRDDNYNSYRHRNLNKNVYISIYKNKKNLGKKLTEIEEEQKKEENEKLKEKEIGSEIKDTVKCYICFDKITKPKMCPHCHRIACEKCLYNWFINLKKEFCGFCREKINFKQMVSVPFMEKVVNFVDKFFNKKNISEDNDYNSNKDFLEYCPEHLNEMLYYYCLDCGKAYCKTCFVFFGEEKDKHNGHSIIEYEKYKNMSFPLLKKNKEKLEKNIQHVEENIKRCYAYKTIYEHERKVGNEFIKKLQNEFNGHIDNIIDIIEQQISQLKQYVNEYNKYKNELDDFYKAIKNKKIILKYHVKV